MLQSLYTSTALIMALTVTSIVVTGSPAAAKDVQIQITKKSLETMQTKAPVAQISVTKTPVKVKVPSVQMAAGPSRTGGGNGVQSKEGDITPLEVIFANSNKDLNPQSSYPVGYKYFQTIVQKIKVAIPSFAKDIEQSFKELKWIGTTLELTQDSCRNSTGIFRIDSAGKQVVVACQNEDGEVYLNLKNAKLMKKPEYMGIIFLHETFVRKLIYSYSEPRDYKNAEVLMITKINPYLISNATLDPKKVYDFTSDLGFRRYQSSPDYNSYALEVFPEVLESYKKQEASLAAVTQLENKAKDLLNEYLVFVKIMETCDVNDARLNSSVALTEFVKTSLNKYFEAAEAESTVQSEYENLSHYNEYISESNRYLFSSKYLGTIGPGSSQVRGWRDLDFSYGERCTVKLKEAGKIP